MTGARREPLRRRPSPLTPPTKQEQGEAPRSFKLYHLNLQALVKE